MVYRVYVEKKEALANEARALLENLRTFLGIESLTGLRLFNRYDLEDISRELFDYTVRTVLSEPQLDTVTDTLPQGDTVFAVEYLPGQYDQRADSAAQCVQILSQGERPLVRTARVYALEGKLTDAEIAAIKQYVINPVESREASLELPETLRMEYDIPTTVRTVDGFTAMDSAALDALRDKLARDKHAGRRVKPEGTVFPVEHVRKRLGGCLLRDQRDHDRRNRREDQHSQLVFDGMRNDRHNFRPKHDEHRHERAHMQHHIIKNRHLAHAEQGLQ